MTILDVVADAMRHVCAMLGVTLERSVVDEILAPAAEDIQLAYTHWLAFS